MEALREEKTAPFLSVDEQSTARTRNFSAWVLSNSWSQENVCLRPKPPPSLCVRRIQKQNRGESELTREECVREKNGKRGWSGQVGKGLTVLPPHSQRHSLPQPPAAITPQLPNKTLKRLTREDGKSTR